MVDLEEARRKRFESWAVYTLLLLLLLRETSSRNVIQVLNTEQRLLIYSYFANIKVMMTFYPHREVWLAFYFSSTNQKKEVSQWMLAPLFPIFVASLNFSLDHGQRRADVCGLNSLCCMRRREAS